MKALFTWICLLGLALPILAQQPLFDIKKEFPASSFASIKPGIRYMMEQGSDAMLPKLFKVTPTPKGPRPGERVASGPLQKAVFTFVKFVAYEDDKSGRDEVLAIMDTPKGQYGILMAYTMAQLTTNRFLKTLPYFINLDEFERAKRLLEGKTIYPTIHYVEQGTKPDADDSYVWLPKLVPVKVNKVALNTGAAPIQLTFTYPGGEPQVRDYTLSGEGVQNVTNPIFDTRFDHCFTLANPRDTYASTKEVTWKAIVKGVPQKGMTMKECRLAMGKPRSQSDSIEQAQITTWYYDEHLGRSWQVSFVDGKLTQAHSYQSN